MDVRSPSRSLAPGARRADRISERSRWSANSLIERASIPGGTWRQIFSAPALLSTVYTPHLARRAPPPQNYRPERDAAYPVRLPKIRAMWKSLLHIGRIYEIRPIPQRSGPR